MNQNHFWSLEFQLQAYLQRLASFYVYRDSLRTEKEGYLFKETKGVIKDLQRKYFVLSGMNLYYFKTKQVLQFHTVSHC